MSKIWYYNSVPVLLYLSDVVLRVHIDVLGVGQVLALGAVVILGPSHLLAIEGCAIVPATKCDPSGIVNACLWDCWDMAYLGHRIVDPILVLHCHDLFLDQVAELLAGHLVG